jgi:hypothetical protein
VHLASVHREIDTAQDLMAGSTDVEIADMQHNQSFAPSPTGEGRREEYDMV